MARSKVLQRDRRFVGNVGPVDDISSYLINKFIFLRLAHLDGICIRSRGNDSELSDLCDGVSLVEEILRKTSKEEGRFCDLSENDLQLE
ncbi:hypothetical protein ACTXT7_000078 [Hymenolepis weldensis]